MTASSSPTTRTGKIARLPRQLRDELNRRLDNGEQGKRLVAWLNAEPAVKEIMAADFKGRPVREQNLSEWKKGGYQDWLHHQEALAMSAAVPGGPEAPETGPTGPSLTDRLSTLAALSLARVINAATTAESLAAPRTSRALVTAVRLLNLLRRSDHQAFQAGIDHLRAERDQVESRSQPDPQASQATVTPIPAATRPVHSRPFAVNPGESDHPLSTPPAARSPLAPMVPPSSIGHQLSSISPAASPTASPPLACFPIASPHPGTHRRPSYHA